MSETRERVHIEDGPKRVRTYIGGKLIADTKRLKLVWEIQRRLDAEVARPMLSWRKEYFVQWPHVRNLVPHNSLYNYGRMQEVWLDR